MMNTETGTTFSAGMPRSEIQTTKIIEPSSPHTHTVINLHGRGSNASDYSKDFFESQDRSGQTLLNIFPSVKWVFPSAPQIFSAKYQCSMSQWFDMWTTADPHERSEEQTAQVRESVTTIAHIVRHEGTIIGIDNVVLCGISQGASTALAVLSDLDIRLCAFIGFSTWLPGCFVQSSFSLKQSHKTPVFLAHCEDDEVINVRYGEELRDRLGQLEMSVDFHTYVNGGHWFKEPEGIEDLVEFLRNVIKVD